jgi:ABC-type transport system involved in multi-copper enzyme maturation permease subunit
MTLFTTEVRRLLHRRMLLWLVLIMLALVVTVVVINVAISDPQSFNPNDAMRTTDLWIRGAAARRLGVNPTYRVGTISVLCFLMVIVIGATAVGAEYRAGTVTTVLTWEPRRIRLLTARLAAVALVAIGFYLVINVVFVATWAIGAAANGITTGADAEFWQVLALVIARGAVLAAVLAVLSGAIATLGRNTGAALGIWFGYLIAVEAILGNQVRETAPWTLTVSSAAFFGWRTYTLSGHRVGPVAGTLHVLLYVVVIGGAALAVFARRDVA